MTTNARDTVSDRARAELHLQSARQDAYYADARLSRCPSDTERLRLRCIALARVEKAAREAGRTELLR